MSFVSAVKIAASGVLLLAAASSSVTPQNGFALRNDDGFNQTVALTSFPVGNIVSEVRTGKCVSVHLDRKDDNAPIVQFTCIDGASHQLFSFDLDAEKNAFRIRVLSTNKCLGVKNGSRKPGAPIVQQPCEGHDYQLWQTKGGRAHTVLQVLHSGLNMHILYGSKKNNRPLIQFKFQPEASQQLWRVNAGVPVLLCPGPIEHEVGGTQQRQCIDPNGVSGTAPCNGSKSQSLVFRYNVERDAYRVHSSTAASRCLGIVSAQPAAGAKVALETCQDDPLQFWRFWGGGDSQQVQALDSGMCLNLDNSTTDGELRVWPCSETGSSKLWRIGGSIPSHEVNDGGSIVAELLNGKCLEVVERNATGIARVVQNKCTEGANQQFTFELVYEQDIYRIRAQHSRECIGVINGSNSSISSVVQQPCEDKPFQLWHLEGVGARRQLRAAHSGLCMSIDETGLNKDGAAIYQKPCSGAPSQLWQVAAELAAVTVANCPLKPNLSSQTRTCKDDTTLTFERDVTGRLLGNGEVIDQTVKFDGVTFEARRNGRGPLDPYVDGMIFDAGMVTREHEDLGFRWNRNILIISQDNDPSDPDDNNSGGEIKVTFSTITHVKAMRFFDVEKGARVDFYRNDGDLVKTFAVPPVKDNEQFFQSFRVFAKEMVVTLFGSGGIDDISIRQDCSRKTPSQVVAPSKSPVAAPTVSPIQNSVAAQTISPRQTPVAVPTISPRQIPALVTTSPPTRIPFAAIEVATAIVAGANNTDRCDYAVDRLVGFYGDSVTYCFRVTNSGYAALQDVRLSDPKLGLEESIDRLNSGEERVFTLNAVIRQTLRTNVTATATAVLQTGEHPFVHSAKNSSVQLMVTEPPTPAPLAAAISIDNAVVHGANNTCEEFDEASNKLVGILGEEVTFCLRVTNTGDAALVNVVVSDPVLNFQRIISKLSPGSIEIVPVNSVLTKNETNTAIATGTPAHDDFTPVARADQVSSFDNSSVVVAVPQDNSPSPSDPLIAAPPVGTHAIIVIHKLVPGLVDPNLCEDKGVDKLAYWLGENVTHCIKVTNKGDSLLINVSVTDPILNYKEDIPVLQSGQTILLLVTTVVSKNETSVVTVSGTPAFGDFSPIPGVNKATASAKASIIVKFFPAKPRPFTPSPSAPPSAAPSCEPSNEVIETPGPTATVRSIRVDNTVLPGFVDDPQQCPGDDVLFVKEGDPVTFCLTVANDGDMALIVISFVNLDLGLSEFIPVIESGENATFLIGAFVPGNFTSTAVANGMPAFDAFTPVPGAPFLTGVDSSSVVVVDGHSLSPTSAPTIRPSTAKPTNLPTLKPTQCVETVLIDFEKDALGIPLKRGAVIDDSVIFDGGVTFKGRRIQRGDSGPFLDAMIFDTTSPSGNDFDLSQADPSQRNILILSADNNSLDPDDAARGGRYVLTFETAVTLHSLKLIDSQSPAIMRFFGINGGRPFKRLTVRGDGDGSVRAISLEVTGVKSFSISLTASGALDDIRFSRPCPTSEPTLRPTVRPTCLEDSTTTFEVDALGNILQAGDIIDETVQFGAGATYKARRAQDGPDGPFNAGMIFDTTRVSGNDKDLGVDPERRNVLIISEDFDSEDPDDNFGGGTIIANYTRPVTIEAIRIVDTEEEGGNIELFDAFKNVIASAAIPVTGNGIVRRVLIQTSDVSSAVVTLAGSGAIDDIEITSHAGCPPSNIASSMATGVR